MIRIILSGCNGRMGRAITDIVSKNPAAEIVAGIDLNTDSSCGYPVYSTVAEVTEPADVLIDFSHPSLLSGLLAYCVEHKLPAVIATTGCSEEQLAEIDEAATKVPMFRSGNMSLGINVLLMLVERAAKILGDTFDVEVIERHHNQKIDAPSGTALMIADRLKEALPHQSELVYDRHAVRQKRGYQEIGMHSLRGGTIVGVHEVVFAGRDEVVELRHEAQSREVFAAGAVKAALFLTGMKAPKLYNMDDLVATVMSDKL